MRFTYRLAGHLKVTRRELLERIDARELAEWEALETLEPWGEYAESLRFAKLAAKVAGAWGVKVELAEFIPTVEPIIEVEPEEERREIGERIKNKLIAFGARMRAERGG